MIDGIAGPRVRFSGNFAMEPQMAYYAKNGLGEEDPILPTRNVVLSDQQESMIARLVASGRYQNASEVVREGLRLIDRREAEDDIRLRALREAAEVGIADIAAGRYRVFDSAEGLREYLSELTADTLDSGAPDGKGR